MVTPDATERTFTIEELARESGMTVRNIRAHQSRGLLPPPDVRGRTGRYGPEHLTRLGLIKEMQADGFNLRAIERLLAAAAPGEQILGFKRLLLTPFEDERAEVLTSRELEARFGEPADAELARKAQRLGLVRPLGDDRFEIPSPTLLRAGEELLSLGIGLATALEVAERIERHSQGVARAFVKLFLEEVWRPFQEAGMPEEQWPRVREALARLRPLASESLLAMFKPTMSREIEEAFERQLEQADGKRRRRRSRSRSR